MHLLTHVNGAAAARREDEAVGEGAVASAQQDGERPSACKFRSVVCEEQFWGVTGDDDLGETAASRTEVGCDNVEALVLVDIREANAVWEAPGWQLIR